MRIVIADDEAEIRDYFRRILARLGHEVVAEAEDGRELLQLCLSVRPDLVITDVKMPEMDGDEVMRRLAVQSPTPFLLVSAYWQPESANGEFDGVRWRHLNKPINRRQLEAAIAAVTGGRASR